MKYLTNLICQQWTSVSILVLLASAISIGTSNGLSQAYSYQDIDSVNMMMNSDDTNDSSPKTMDDRGSGR